MHGRKMEIHLAQSEDVQLLAEMNFQLIKDEGHSNPMGVVELRERMSRWLDGVYSAVLIGERSQVVGYALWRNEKEYLYIRQFFVLPDHRGKGIGREAIQLLKKQNWKNMALRLDVLAGNKRGLSFWRAVGFNEYCITLTSTNE